MSAVVDTSVTKIAENVIILKAQINDLNFGLKELSGKLDTIIALLQVVAGHPQQRQ